MLYILTVKVSSETNIGFLLKFDGISLSRVINNLVSFVIVCDEVSG